MFCSLWSLECRVLLEKVNGVGCQGRLGAVFLQGRVRKYTDMKLETKILLACPVLFLLRPPEVENWRCVAELRLLCSFLPGSLF